MGLTSVINVIFATRDTIRRNVQAIHTLTVTHVPIVYIQLVDYSVMAKETLTDLYNEIKDILYFVTNHMGLLMYLLYEVTINFGHLIYWLFTGK